MPFVFLIFRNYTRGRIARSSKIEGLKGIMGLSKARRCEPSQRKWEPAEGETRENKRRKSPLSGTLLSVLSLLLLLRFSFCCSLYLLGLEFLRHPPQNCCLRFRNSCLEKSWLLLLFSFQSLVIFSSSPAQPLSRPLSHIFFPFDPSIFLEVSLSSPDLLFLSLSSKSNYFSSKFYRS